MQSKRLSRTLPRRRRIALRLARSLARTDPKSNAAQLYGRRHGPRPGIIARRGAEQSDPRRPTESRRSRRMFDSPKQVGRGNAHSRRCRSELSLRCTNIGPTPQQLGGIPDGQRLGVGRDGGRTKLLHPARAWPLYAQQYSEPVVRLLLRPPPAEGSWLPSLSGAPDCARRRARDPRPVSSSS